MFNIDNVIRKNVKELIPYSSAREEFSGTANVWLDANENPYDTPLNRYPDPYQKQLKKAIAAIKDVTPEQLFIGNGSDEAIDLLFRAFCEPGRDKAFIFPPTYGMYQVSARINNVEVVKISLNDQFQLPVQNIIKNTSGYRGLLFICSPNNPTGNTFALTTIKEIADNFPGIVVIDEAYIDFSTTESAISLLDTTPNLVILQTLSKAYGLAGIRVGMAFADEKIIAVLNKIKPPYNVSALSQIKALEAVKNRTAVQRQIAEIQDEREKLIASLKTITAVKKSYPTEANFILVKFENAHSIYTALQHKGIIIRNRTSEIAGCLRITVGTAKQNKMLLQALKEVTT